jgi:hypothetical protein
MLSTATVRAMTPRMTAQYWMTNSTARAIRPRTKNTTRNPPSSRVLYDALTGPR